MPLIGHCDLPNASMRVAATAWTPPKALDDVLYLCSNSTNRTPNDLQAPTARTCIPKQPGNKHKITNSILAEWIDKWMDGWMDGWMDKGTDKWMDG